MIENTEILLNLISNIDFFYSIIQLIFIFWIILFGAIIISPDNLSKTLIFSILLITYLLFANYQIKLQMEIHFFFSYINSIESLYPAVYKIILQIYYIETMLKLLNSIGLIFVFISIIIIIYEILN